MTITSRSYGSATHTYAPRRPSLSRRLGTVLIAARLLGIEHDGRSLAWCPGCGVESGRRGSKLRRGGSCRVGVSQSGLGWRCYSCSAGGSSADLVSWHRFRRPVAELDRDQLRELGQYVDQLTGDMPVLPARAAYVPPRPLTAEEREARAREADDRRWQRTLDEAALYLHDLRRRTGTSTEREAWDALATHEPPDWAPVVWRGHTITWPAIHAAHLIQLHERRATYFAELAELEDAQP